MAGVNLEKFLLLNILHPYCSSESLLWVKIKHLWKRNWIEIYFHIVCQQPDCVFIWSVFKESKDGNQETMSWIVCLHYKELVWLWKYANLCLEWFQSSQAMFSLPTISVFFHYLQLRIPLENQLSEILSSGILL